MRMLVQRKGYFAELIPNSVTIGLDKEIEFKVFTKDYDNTGDEFHYQWSCFDQTSNAECLTDEFNDAANDTLIFQSIIQRDYQIKVIVSLNDVEKILISSISVNPLIIVRTNISQVPTKAIPSNEPFQLHSTLFDLIPNCYAEWIVVKEDSSDFGYFDSHKVIPNGLGNTTVRDVEKSFLSELVDYGNDTVIRDITLFVPTPNNDSWKGLEPNVKYKFRLMTTCPEPIDDQVTSEQPRRNITSTTDIVIETNGPPIGGVLEVTPIKGVALQTIFKFSTEIADDVPTDYPLKYSFQYIADGITVNLGDFYEIMVTTTDLPYTKTPIQTLFIVCDSRGACATPIYGPNITTTPFTNITNEEFQFKQEFIKKNLQDLEIDTGFGSAIAYVLTFQVIMVLNIF